MGPFFDVNSAKKLFFAGLRSGVKVVGTKRCEARLKLPESTDPSYRKLPGSFPEAYVTARPFPLFGPPSGLQKRPQP